MSLKKQPRRFINCSEPQSSLASPFSGPTTPIKNPAFSLSLKHAAGRRSSSVEKLPRVQNLSQKLSFSSVAASSKAHINSASEAINSSYNKEFLLIDDKVRNFCNSENNENTSKRIRFQIEILEEIMKLPSGISDFLRVIQYTLHDALSEIESNKWKKKYDGKAKQVVSLINEKIVLNEKIEDLIKENTILKTKFEELKLKNVKTMEAFGKCKESPQYKLIEELHEKNKKIKEIKWDVSHYKLRESKIIMMLQELRSRGLETGSIMKKYNISFGSESESMIYSNLEHNTNSTFSSATLAYFQEFLL
ncbi:unnamed protein product [Blepharisma stoltei]|uniref:Uncharacterized protein n=1 Tax=Blepharisma stoltei TaxID=1481888 RepID=A0AAU9IEK8_9CILI|nr:unnamed protein product [Blepharisma stoltei]